MGNLEDINNQNLPLTEPGIPNSYSLDCFEKELVVLEHSTASKSIF